MMKKYNKLRFNAVMYIFMLEIYPSSLTHTHDTNTAIVIEQMARQTTNAHKQVLDVL